MSRVLPLMLLLACDDKADETTEAPESSEETLPADTAEPEVTEEEDPEPEDTGDGELAGDEYANQACALLEESKTEELILAASEKEAAQLTIVADGVPRRLMMPEKGDGWLVLEMPDWMAYLRIFTDEGTTFEFDLAEKRSEPILCEACPDAGITDQSWAIHSWGAYPIQFHEGPEEIWFLVIEE